MNKYRRKEINIHLSEEKPSIKDDCFALVYVGSTNKPHCLALNRVYCTREKCNFYKTKEQYEKEKKKYGSVD